MNWNIWKMMLVIEEGEKLEFLDKDPLERGQEPVKA